MKDFVSSSDVLFLVLAIAQAIDICTGIWKTRSSGQFSTKTMTTGLCRKLADWIYIGIGFLIPCVLIHFGNVLGVDFTVSRTLGWVVLASIMYKETRSIFENLSTIGMPVPEILKKALVLAGKEFDGDLTLPTDEDAFALNLNKSLPELNEKDTITLRVKK